MYILGKGGFALSLAKWIHYKNIAFDGFISLDSDIPILFTPSGITKTFDYPQSAKFVLGTTNTRWRARFLQQLKEHYPLSISYFPNVILTDTIFYSDIGVGNIIMPNSILENRSEIGDFNLFNLNSVLSYESSVGNNNTIDISANILHRTHIKNNNFIGAKACISQNIVVGSNNNIDIGECLFEDMRDNELFRSGIITEKK